MATTDGRSSSPGDPDRNPRRNYWLIGGLAGALVLFMLCALVAVAGTVLLLRPRTTALEPAPQVPEASESVAEPSAPPADLIAFIDTDGQLGIVANDGSDRRMLTSDGVRYQFPAWAPDGRRIAAIGSDGWRGSVRIVEDGLGGGEDQPQELYSSAERSPFYLYWSPDGQQVSFLANDRGGIALHLVPADGSQESRVLTRGQPMYWDWTSNSDQLLVHSGGSSENARLGFIDTTGAPVGLQVPAPGFFQAPGISASGRYLAFAAIEGRELQVVAQASQGSQRIQVPHQGIAAMTWSPVEDLLAFTSPQVQAPASFGPLRVLDADTGQVRTLANEVVLAFFWAPDGRSIAYLTLESRSGAPGALRPWVPAPTSSHGQLVARPLQSAREARVRLSVVDVATGERRVLTSFRPTSLFVSQFLPFFDQYALSHRIWSPDSRFLVLPMLEGESREVITVISAEDGSTTPVADGSMAFWSPR
jgi:TolB protein